MSSTRRTGRGWELVEIPPLACPNGHPLRPPNVQVGYLPCSCAEERARNGHRFWRCWTCGAVIYEPPHTDWRQETAYRPR